MKIKVKNDELKYSGEIIELQNKLSAMENVLGEDAHILIRVRKEETDVLELLYSNRASKFVVTGRNENMKDNIQRCLEVLLKTVADEKAMMTELNSLSRENKLRVMDMFMLYDERDNFDFNDIINSVDALYSAYLECKVAGALKGTKEEADFFESLK